MSTKTVYMAGPVTGCTQAETEDWREYVSSKLHKNIIAVSPLRGEEKLEEGKRFEALEPGSVFRTPGAIAAKNHYDTHTCDLVLAYLPQEHNERRPSYGTLFELGWATGAQKPTILVTDDPIITEHPLFLAKVNWIFDNFDDAIQIINALFDVYVGNEE